MVKYIMVVSYLLYSFSAYSFQESMNSLSSSPSEVLNPKPGSAGSGISSKSSNDKVQKERERVQKEVQRVLTLTGHDGKIKNVINKTQTNVNAVIKESGKNSALQETQIKLNDLKKQVKATNGSKNTAKNKSRPIPRTRPR